jgi:hypothetical protein
MAFVDYPPARSVRRLLDRVLLKAREMTGAEAGSVFIMRERDGEAVLDAASVQNDALEIARRRISRCRWTGCPSPAMRRRPAKWS